MAPEMGPYLSMTIEIQNKLNYPKSKFFDELSKISKNKKIIVSFSLGKDSVVATQILIEAGFDVELVYQYLIPNLAFVNESIDYAENYFKKKIYQVAHPSLYRWLSNSVFQTEQTIKKINKWGAYTFDYDDIFKLFFEDFSEQLNLDNDYYATGVCAADTPQRWINVKKFGPILHNKKKILPIYDHTRKETYSKIKLMKYKLPIDYKLFGRSFDGISYMYIKPIKDNFPNDFEKIKEFFPSIETLFIRQNIINHQYEN